MATFVVVAIIFVIASASARAADMASAEVINTNNEVIGKVTFEQTPTGVLIFVEVTGLPPGPHAIHLHSVGACTPDFKAAKGHVNPDKVQHGLRNPDGPDNGDLPNLFVGADGTAMAEFFTTRVSVATGDTPPLLDEDGSAVIIHENRDDHMAQPIGGAGGRIACAIINKM
jgi:Cu-Zn family superoxide dismutase